MVDLVTMRDLSSPSDSLGRYRLVGVLGQGDLSTVHLAISTGLGAFKKLVVVKELKQELAGDPGFVDLFIAGARLAARLNHPNVVHTLEADREGHRHFLAMEFLDGQSLGELTRRTLPAERLSLAAHVRILCDVLSGLQYAHDLADYDGRELHIVHQDVNPENVFVTYDGQVKVLDFGSGQSVPRDGTQEETTNPAVFKGRLGYAAPEQVRGRATDRRTDVFAVGVMLWEALTGRPFHSGPSTPDAVKARLFGLEPRVARVAPNTPHGLANICNRAIAVDPADRYSSAEDFREALIAFLRASGELSDTRSIAGKMRTMFAQERAAMHRIIETALNGEEQPDSSVRSRPPMDSRSDEQPTVPTNLPPPPEPKAWRASVPSIPDDAPDFRPDRRRRLAAIVVVGAVIAAALGFWVGLMPEHANDAAAPASGSASPPAAAPSITAAEPIAPTPEAPSAPALGAATIPPLAPQALPRRAPQPKPKAEGSAPHDFTPGNPYEE